MTKPALFATPNPISYGRQPGRDWRRLVYASLLLSLLALLAFWAWPRATAWWVNYRQWRYAMNFSPRVDTPSLTVKQDETQDSFGKAFARRARPHQFDRSEQARDRILVNRPSTTPGSLTAVFHGPLQTAHGHRRFVSVGANATWFPEGVSIGFDVRCFLTGEFLSPQFTEVPVRPDAEVHIPGQIPNFPGQLYGPFEVAWGHDLQVFPAERDATNPARAVGRFSLDGVVQDYVIELHDDDTVTLRDGNGAPLRVKAAPPRPESR